MNFIQTTFAHGNGPYSRLVDLVLAYNDVRERNGQNRLPAVFPLIPKYRFQGQEPGSRQIQFMKETAETAGGKDFLKNHPHELLLDLEHGELLERVLYDGNNYEDALANFLSNANTSEQAFQRLLDRRKAEVQTLTGETIELDRRDSELELSYNNRIRTGHQCSYYIDGGAGYFSEILRRAMLFPTVELSKDVLQRVIPLTERLTDYQKLHFLSDPGVFSYDSTRKKQKPTEISTPSQIHTPQIDTTPLEEPGVYFVLTGIQGIANSGIYDLLAERIGAQVYSGHQEFNTRHNGIFHPPFKIAHPKIIAQVARSGWSSVWAVHLLAERQLTTGFLFLPYTGKDDPEILMNNLSIQRLNLGVQIDLINPRTSLEEALAVATSYPSFNQTLKKKYGTLDGINYTAETIFMTHQGKDISSRLTLEPA